MNDSDPGKANAKSQLKLGLLQHNLGYLMRVARNVVMQSSGEFVGDLGYVTGQITLLGLIAANEGTAQNDLGRALLMRKSQVTGLIQDLVARGLVERSAQGADRRFNAVKLTPAGEKAWHQARDRIGRHSASLLVEFSDAERDELLRLLRKLIATNLQEVDFELD